jgi:hypothetical protein
LGNDIRRFLLLLNFFSSTSVCFILGQLQPLGFLGLKNLFWNFFCLVASPTQPKYKTRVKKFETRAKISLNSGTFPSLISYVRRGPKPSQLAKVSRTFHSPLQGWVCQSRYETKHRMVGWETHWTRDWNWKGSRHHWPTYTCMGYQPLLWMQWSQDPMVLVSLIWNERPILIWYIFIKKLKEYNNVVWYPQNKT